MLKNKEAIRLREELGKVREELETAKATIAGLASERDSLKVELVACKEELSSLKKTAPSPKREEVTKGLMERWALDRIRWIVRGYLARKAYKKKVNDLLEFDFGTFESKFADFSDDSTSSEDESEVSAGNAATPEKGMVTPPRIIRHSRPAVEESAEEVVVVKESSPVVVASAEEKTEVAVEAAPKLESASDEAIPDAGEAKPSTDVAIENKPTPEKIPEAGNEADIISSSDDDLFMSSTDSSSDSSTY